MTAKLHIIHTSDTYACRGEGVAKHPVPAVACPAGKSGNWWRSLLQALSQRHPSPPPAAPATWTLHFQTMHRANLWLCRKPVLKLAEQIDIAWSTDPRLKGQALGHVFVSLITDGPLLPPLDIKV